MKTLSTFSGGYISTSFILLFTVFVTANAYAGKEFPINGGGSNAVSPKSASAVREFAVKKSHAGIQLSWKTAGNNAAPSFEVERSVGGSSFVKIASLKSGRKAVYNFTDKHIFQPAYYYRIRIKSTSGESAYSETIHISAMSGKSTVKQTPANGGSNVKENKMIVLEKTAATASAAPREKIIYNLCTEEYSKLPVYFSEELELVVHAEKAGLLSVNLTTLNGRIRMQRSFMAEAGYNHIEMEELTPLPKGNYTMSVKTGKQLISRKAIKQ